MPNVLAIAEQRDGALRKVSHEVVSAARTVADALSGDVHVLVLGPAGLAEAAAELGRFGADKIFVGESEGFRHSNPDGVTKAIVDLATANGYHTVLFSANHTSPPGKYSWCWNVLPRTSLTILVLPCRSLCRKYCWSS